MKWRLAALVLLLAIPAGTAHSFSASSIDLQWSSLQAPIVAVEFKPEDTGDRFELQAEGVRLETDASKMIVAGEVGHETQASNTTTTFFGQSTWSASTWDVTTNLFVTSTEAKLVAGSGQGTAALPNATCVRQPVYFESNRPVVCPSTATALQLRGVASQWTISGNFTVALWSWQGSVTEGQQVTQFWTGTKPTQTNVLGQGELEFRRAYLYVTGGTLTIMPVNERVLDLYSPSVTAMDASAILPNGLSGTVGVSEVVTSTELSLSRMDSKLVGQMDDAALVGSPATVTGTRAGWPIGALGAAALFAPLGIMLVHRNRGLTHISYAKDNLDIENYAAAARHARKAVRHRSLRSRAGLLGAVACIRRGELADAEEFLQDMQSGRFHDQAAHRFLLAHIRIQQGRRQEGQDLLEECLRINPKYAEDAAASPVMAPFVDPSVWPGQD